ncbi:MAG: D-alanine--D-alanine ligase [Candidatus Gastranaerophilales bacterium]|nr:D-alanine--D-alanine ligase [Candidatus Gastranaerophilales bacterium]
MQNIIQNKIDKNSKIAVLCGGMSSEAEISRRSGKGCFEALQRLGYKNAELVEVDTNITEKLKEGKYDYAYNALHGKFGEDGCIQGILEILQIPYTGCGVMASSVCMNKEYTKRILSTCPEIPLIKSVFVQKGDNVKEKTKNLNYPLITKPVCEGSSFGMTKVNTPDELEKAYLDAVKYNDDVLIEEYLIGIAATVGVLENDNGLFATEILELRPKKEWYDYECKYTKGMTEFILPAELSDEMTKQVKEIAVKAFKIAGCKGVSRVDFHIVNNIPYVLEINTSPGMTETSDLPAQANAMGINYDNLVEIILNGAGLNK